MERSHLNINATRGEKKKGNSLFKNLFSLTGESETLF